MAVSTSLTTTNGPELPADVTSAVQTSLADLTEDEFQAGLARVETALRRQDEIMKRVLVEGRHYGNPKQDNGKRAFKKNIMYQQGADHLVKTFNFAWGVGEQADVEVVTPEFVRVTVYRRLIDLRGRVLASAEGSCTSHEKKFVASWGTGWTWGKDARSELHTIRASAAKRCRVAAVLEGLGLRGLLEPEDAEGEDEHEQSAGDARAVQQMTDRERQTVMDAASGMGMSRGDLKALKQKLFGGREMGSGRDVKVFLDAIAVWTPAPAFTGAAPSGTPEPEDFPRVLEEVG